MKTGVTISIMTWAKLNKLLPTRQLHMRHFTLMCVHSWTKPHKGWYFCVRFIQSVSIETSRRPKDMDLATDIDWTTSMMKQHNWSNSRCWKKNKKANCTRSLVWFECRCWCWGKSGCKIISVSRKNTKSRKSWPLPRCTSYASCTVTEEVRNADTRNNVSINASANEEATTATTNT